MPAHWYYALVILAAFLLCFGVVLLNEMIVRRQAEAFRRDMLASRASPEKRELGDGLVASITGLVDREGRLR